MRRVNFKDMQAELRQLRETALLEEASRLLRESNYDALNMDTLAEAVGISKKTLYQHFRTRDELVAQVLIKGSQALEAEIFKIAPDTAPLLKIERIMSIYLRERFFPGSVMAAIGPEMAVRLKYTDSAVQQQFQRIEHLIGEIVDAAKAVGELRSDISTQVMVRSLFCLAGALQNFAVVHQVESPMTMPADLDRRIKEVISVFMFGVAAPSR